MRHIPVFLKEVLDVIAPKDRGKYFDGTLGAGGHAMAILEKSSPQGMLAGTDLDEEAIEETKKVLSSYKDRLYLVNANYIEINNICNYLGWEGLDGIILDLGLSSMVIEDKSRGFSFQTEGPLDMRYSSENPISAYDVVNFYSRDKLLNIIREYGEERFASRIANAIIKRRPIKTTKDLSTVVRFAIPRRFWPRRIHPATKTFQAIRIEVNREIENLRQFLPRAVDTLAPGGVIAVISFHSIEDRIVKRFFRGEYAASTGVTLEPLFKKPVRPGPEELMRNPRSRSARLRAARRLD